MQRIEYQSVGDVLRNLMTESDLGVHLDEMKAIEAWGKVVGEALAGRMGRPRVSRGVMTVVTRHAPLRQEMMMHRTALAEAINRVVGKEVIREIVFINA